MDGGLKVGHTYSMAGEYGVDKITVLMMRGRELAKGDLVYVNDWTGSLREFSGVERIFWREKEIYRLVYHGGLLHW